MEFNCPRRMCKILTVLLPYLLYAAGENKVQDYSGTEKTALKQLRRLVQGVIYEDYMGEDKYLINWLRAKTLNVNAAADAIRTTMQWRQENKIDGILKENFGDLRKELRFRCDGIDRHGRPFSEADLASFDLRRLVLSGQGARYTRTNVRNLEEVMARVRDTGLKNVTQWSYVANVGSYNLRQHACLACIPLQLQLFRDYEAHYPGTAYRQYIVNAPRIIHALYNLILPLLSEQSRTALVVYGLDKQEWERELFKDISPSQLLKVFGGTKV